MAELGKFKKVSIKEIWPKEAADFTPWLADNLNLLSDEIGIDFDTEDELRQINTEVRVGGFSADIVAKDTQGNKVVIENQYGMTNHDHLGKMLTYAAGVEAKTIVWITENVRDEHKKAIEFLNNNSTENINFFLVQIEAWKINDSLPAPRFNVVESPNEWSKIIKATSEGKDSSGLGEEKIRFWQKVRDYAVERYPEINWRKPLSEHWYSLGVGSSVSHIDMVVNSKTKKVGVIYSFWPHGFDKGDYDFFAQNKDRIEGDLGMKLKWERKERNQYSRAYVEFDGNYRKEEEQEKLAKWLADTAVKFYNALPKYDRTRKEF